MTTGVLMGFPQTSSGVVGNTAGGLFADMRFGNVYGVCLSGNVGIRKWDAYPNGIEKIAANLSTLNVAGIYFYQAVTYNTQQLVISNGASNSGAIYGFSLADLTYQSTFGTISASLANSSATRILSPQQLVCFVDSHGRDIVVSCSLRDGSFTGGKEINCIFWGSGSNTPSYCTENAAVLGAKADGSGTEAWAFGYTIGAAGGHLYRIAQTLGGAGIVSTVGQVLPAHIDAAWTAIDQVAGITVDETDGNLIMGFSTNAGTPEARIVKLNKTTAAVMWSTAVGTGTASDVNVDAVDMAKNVVKNGLLYYLAFNNVVYTINTITGAATTQAVNALGLQSIGGHQMSEDISGSIILYGTFSDLGITPAYFGNYCFTQGNHSGTSIGWRYWPGNTNPPPQPAFGVPAVSRKRAWSFVLDGHTFYVLDLGKQGTFVCDTSTGNQWAQFITTGYLNWNFANGCMWGQRIVAGDLLTTDVWEMNPSSLLDNGAATITHVVTGGVVTRNRIYHSVDVLSLACSVGQSQTANGTVLLSFSDDQGKTWTDMDTKTLTQGDFSGEIAWQSLGSFESPGRIFKITDSGGFLRIDGVDAGIDGFDAATADPGG